MSLAITESEANPSVQPLQSGLGADGTLGTCRHRVLAHGSSTAQSLGTKRLPTRVDSTAQSDKYIGILSLLHPLATRS